MNVWRVLQVLYFGSILYIIFFIDPKGISRTIEMIIIFYCIPAFAVLIIALGCMALLLIGVMGVFIHSVLVGENKFEEWPSPMDWFKKDKYED